MAQPETRREWLMRQMKEAASAASDALGNKEPPPPSFPKGASDIDAEGNIIPPSERVGPGPRSPDEIQITIERRDPQITMGKVREALPEVSEMHVPPTPPEGPGLEIPRPTPKKKMDPKRFLRDRKAADER